GDLDHQRPVATPAAPRTNPALGRDRPDSPARVSRLSARRRQAGDARQVARRSDRRLRRASLKASHRLEAERDPPAEEVLLPLLEGVKADPLHVAEEPLQADAAEERRAAADFHRL